eukprot:PhM_4_TR4965/c0_g1_i1/m.26407
MGCGSSSSRRDVTRMESSSDSSDDEEERRAARARRYLVTVMGTSGQATSRNANSRQRDLDWMLASPRLRVAALAHASVRGNAVVKQKRDHGNDTTPKTKTKAATTTSSSQDDIQFPDGAVVVVQYMRRGSLASPTPFAPGMVAYLEPPLASGDRHHHDMPVNVEKEEQSAAWRRELLEMWLDGCEDPVVPTVAPPLRKGAVYEITSKTIDEERAMIPQWLEAFGTDVTADEIENLYTAGKRTDESGTPSERVLVVPAVAVENEDKAADEAVAATATAELTLEQLVAQHKLKQKGLDGRKNTESLDDGDDDDPHEEDDDDRCSLHSTSTRSSGDFYVPLTRKLLDDHHKMLVRCLLWMGGPPTASVSMSVSSQQLHPPHRGSAMSASSSSSSTPRAKKSNKHPNNNKNNNNIMFGSQHKR